MSLNNAVMLENTLKMFLPDDQATRALGALIAEAMDLKGVVALSGQLGTGKTTFSQGLGTFLGVREVINSPTFTMLNEYHSGRVSLYHFDLYRLLQDVNNPNVDQKRTALVWFKFELDEIMFGQEMILIEWPEAIVELLPDDYLKVDLAYAEDCGRYAQITGIGIWSNEVVRHMTELVIST